MTELCWLPPAPLRLRPLPWAPPAQLRGVGSVGARARPTQLFHGNIWSTKNCKFSWRVSGFLPTFLLLFLKAARPVWSWLLLAFFFPPCLIFSSYNLPTLFFFSSFRFSSFFFNINGGAGISFPLLAERLLEVMDDPRRDFGSLG